jgi:PAS domain S-box-containing protein
MCKHTEGGEGDVEEQTRRSLAEVERRERIYRLMFEHAADPTLIIDDDGRILDENHAMRALHAEGLDELMPRRIGAWALRNMDVASFHQELLRTGRASAETRVTDGSGHRRWIAINAKTHAPSRHVLVLRDVTEQRETEERLDRIRRVDSLGFLTASVVHDLANLIMPILSASTLLARQAPEGSDAAFLADEIRSTAERAGALLRQILAYVRKKSPEITAVSVNTVLRELSPILTAWSGPT